MYSIILRSDDKIMGENNDFTIQLSDVLPQLECGCKYKVKLSNCIISQLTDNISGYVELRIRIGSTTLYDSQIKAYSSELIFFLPDQNDNAIVSRTGEQPEFMVESFNYNNIEVKILDSNGDYLDVDGSPNKVIIVLTFEKV